MSLTSNATLASLNEEQQLAVKQLTGKSLIIAGAGTGKTHTLVHKVISTIESGVHPGAIMLLTFTNKAAAEMTRRVETYIGRPLPELVSGTFHSVAARFLRRYGAAILLPPGFTIMDTDDTKTLFAHLRKELKLDKEPQFPKKAVLYEMLSGMRNRDLSLDELLESFYPDWMMLRQSLATVMQRYREAKRQSCSLDFDDLIEGFRDLLRQESIQNKFRSQFSHIFVDEYQDTNKIQNDIISLLAGADTHLTVVGDDAQSIYSFRGARLENILEFPNTFAGTQVFKLETNYRSTQPILDYANQVILGNQRQFPKQLKVDSPRGGPRPKVLRFYSEMEQSQVLAELIRRRIDSGTSPRDIAVFYRAHSQSMHMQIALSRAGVPFEITSGLRFFEQAHIKDVMAYVRVLANASETVSWLRILRSLPGVGEKTASRILNLAREHTGKPFPVILRAVQKALPAKAQTAWKEMSNALQEIGQIENPEPFDIICRLLEPTYIYNYIRSTYENADYREEDLEQLMAFAKPYSDLPSFLNEMTLASERYHKQGPSRPVLLTTVHQAKGLEWPVVYIIWMAEGRFPSYRSYDNYEQMEEERRLFYVAVTRAKKELIIGFPAYDPTARSGNIYLKPSRFLVDVEQELYDYVAGDSGEVSLEL